jgi:dipeptidyl aminopeptidase/acylaminoacyl peptidase
MRFHPKRLLRLIAVAILLGKGSLRAEVKQPLKPEDLVDLQVVSDPQISPDGTRVAFVITEPADPQKFEKPRDSNIWIVPSDGSEPPRPFATSSKTDISPRWSPDGRSLAFLSNRGEPSDDEKELKNQVFLLRLDGGEAEEITSLKGEVLALKWSPDGKMIAFTARDSPAREEEEKQKKGADEIAVGHHEKFARLWVVNLSDRKAEQVTKQDAEVSGFAWSPDGSELALRMSESPRNDDVYWHSRLVVARRLTGEILRTLSESAADEPKWSPDGEMIAFSEFTPARVASWLALVSASGGQARHLLKDHRGTIRKFEWAPQPKEPRSKQLIVECLEATRVRLYGVDGTTQETRALVNTASRAASFTASTDGKALSYLQEEDSSPADVWSLILGQAPRRLTSLHPQAASWRLGAVKEVSWKSKKDGTTIYGVLITPPDFQPGRPYPTVVQVHGGPQWAWWKGWLGSWHDWGQLLASNGYAVLLPNPRGSTGQGWQFAEANLDDWGGMDFQDIMDGVDYLVGEKIADPERLGIGGWSYGGFMTAWTVTQTNRFKAAVVGAAVTNLFSFNGTTDITPSFLRNYFRDIPVRRREAYDRHSPMTFLKNCKTPSLVLHGQADERVPVGQGWELYNGLKQLGVETEMVVYPRELHALKERAHQLDLLSRVLRWYDQHLKR